MVDEAYSRWHYIGILNLQINFQYFQMSQNVKSFPDTILQIYPENLQIEFHISRVQRHKHVLKKHSNHIKKTE